MHVCAKGGGGKMGTRQADEDGKYWPASPFGTISTKDLETKGPTLGYLHGARRLIIYPWGDKAIFSKKNRHLNSVQLTLEP